MNFIEYLNGYSKDVQDIIDKFRLRQQTADIRDIEKSTEGLLNEILER